MFSFQDVQDARRRTASYIRRTPLYRSQTLSQQLGTNVYIKYELLSEDTAHSNHVAPSTRFSSFSQAQKDNGAVAVSGGNFAQAVAYAGQVLGIQYADHHAGVHTTTIT